jgi:excisionase family DNA binding protein
MINRGAGVPPVVHTVAEAAVILRVKESWLQRRAAAREIPFTMLGGAYHFTVEHIAEIVRINERVPAAAGEPKIRPCNPREPQVSQTVANLRPRPRLEGPRRKRSAA